MYLHQEVKVGELVRNKETREVFIVVDKTSQGLQVVNMHTQYNPAPVLMILPAYADRWVRDVDIDDLDEWEKKMLEDKLKILNLVENA